MVTGDVKTGFWKHAAGASVGIPDTSPYRLIKTKVEAIMRGETNPPGQHPRERWAAEVVADLLKPNPSRYVRHGYLARTLWILSWLIPAWMLDYGFAQVAEFGKLRLLLRDAHEKKKV
jgi:1-acylglycerone phosphate reductase